MSSGNLRFFKIQQDSTIKPFDCGDTDLNEFLTEKAIAYRKELLATTWILEDDEKTVAYLSIFTDSLSVQDSNFASQSQFKRWLKNQLDHPKRHLRQFPAIKIGRLAVCKRTKSIRKGLGTSLVDFVIDIALDLNDKCGCQLITVDAYSQSLVFYEKQGFKYLSPNDEKNDTRQMFLDLRPYLNAENSENLSV